MQVQFRECDFFNIWIWLRFVTTPSPMEQQYIEEIFDSWFFLGKLGGFNAENLTGAGCGVRVSYLPYREADSSRRPGLSDAQHGGAGISGGLGKVLV
jgi:hypothetical protein